MNQIALAIDPDNCAVLLFIAHCNVLLKKWGEARQNYEQCLRIDPSHVNCLMDFADLLHRESQFQEAAAMYRKALTLVSERRKKYSCLVNLGACLGKGGLWEEAERGYRDAAMLRPKRGDPWLGVCISLWNQGKREEARKECLFALRHVPRNVPILCTLAHLEYELGFYEEALAHAEQACRIKENFSDAHIMRSAVLLGLGKNEEAMAAAQMAIRLDPGKHVAHMNLAQAFKLLGRYREAIQEYEKAVQLAPDAWMIHKNLALLYAGEGDFDAADKACRRLTILNEPEAKKTFELIAMQKMSKGWSS